MVTFSYDTKEEKMRLCIAFRGANQLTTRTANVGSFAGVSKLRTPA
jgi:hypothetical protein